MKYLYKKLVIFTLVYFILSFVLYMFDNGHNVMYSIGNYDIEESLNAKNNEYYFDIKGDDDEFNFKINYNFNKEDKILKKLYNKKIGNYNCFFPIFNGSKILSDVMCLKGTTLYYAHDLDNDEINSYFEKYKYDKSIYEDKGESVVVSPTLTLYGNNLPSNNYLATESYRGLTLFNSKEASVNIFENDIYKKPISIFTDKYYLVADYNSEYTFKNFYLVNIINGEKKNIRSYDDISFDSYIMGEVDGKIYLFDKENKKQFMVDILDESVEEVGNKDNIKYYDGSWGEISLNDALSEKKFENKYDIKGYDKVYKYLNNYYLYKKDGDDYLVYMMDERNLKVKSFIFKTDDINDVIYYKDKIYFKDGNDFYSYSIKGVRKVLTNTEFEFNDDISTYVYEK